MQIGAGETAHIFELVVPGVRLARYRARREAQHQRRRERPGLAAAIDDVVDGDAALLADLADDRLLQRLPRLDETGQRRVATARPARLPSEQAAVTTVVNEDDDGWVGPREVVGAV